MAVINIEHMSLYLKYGLNASLILPDKYDKGINSSVCGFIMALAGIIWPGCFMLILQRLQTSVR